MDSRLPRTPVNAQAGTGQTRTNSEENTPQSRKRSRRCYGLQEGRGVAYKRGRVCPSCRAKKIKCKHVPVPLEVFQDEESAPPTTRESSRRANTALDTTDKNRSIHKNDGRSVMNTPEDFKGNPAMGHNPKLKRLFSEVGVSRKSAKASLELEPPSESADARLPKTTDNIGNTPSDIFALTHADDDVFSGNIVAGMTSIGYQQTCHKNQLPMGSSSFYVAPVMYQCPIPPFENELYHAAASDSYLSYDNDIVTEGHFNLRVPPLPQTLSADPRRHNSFECPTDISTQPLVPWPASENLPPSPENTATQPLATSNTDIPSAFGNFSQAPDESCTFTSNTNYTSPPRNTCPQTPPHRIKTPSLSSTFSTIESQRQGPVTPYDPMNTPSRRTTPPPEAPIIHESEEYFSFGDMLNGAGDDEEQFESWDDFQRRDKSKNSAHSQTSV